MFSSLKDHPFAVDAHFKSSLVFTFAVAKEQLQNKIPECLTLDTFQDTYAFVAVAMVQTEALRPKGFPKFMGNNFFLIGYRVFVRYTNKEGKRLRGLYILKSETDAKKMEYMGNTFTHYQYTTTDITQTETENTNRIFSQKSGFEVIVNRKNKAEVPLPKNSPFKDFKEARRFAGPLPFTFTYNQEKKEVLIIEGVRQNWKPQAVEAQSYHFKFLKDQNIENAILANVFEIKDIPYHWKKGKKEVWT